MISTKVKEYIERKSKISSYPKILNIEPTNFCNLNCPICIDKSSREQGFLGLELLQSLIDKNKEILRDQYIWLHFAGEPLLHPKLPEIIKILKNNGIRTRLSTNATLLDKDTSLRLMEAGLDYIVFSVDGFRKETYEKIRRGADFDVVENNIFKFLDIKKEKGLRTKTQIQMIKMKINEDEVKPFIEKWKRTDINYINIKSFCSRAWEAKNIEPFEEISKLKQKIKNRLPCFYLWETLVILWNGDVLVCCQDLQGNLKVGNVKEKSLIEIWNSQKMIELRERQLKGDFSMFPCSQCPDWKGIPRSYTGYFISSAYKFFLKNFFKKELKDEGINIIYNKK